MAHLVRTQWGIDHLLLHGHLDGWLPSFAVGYQEFLFNGPGFTWLAAAVRLLTFGLLSNAGSLKVITVASVALLPLAVVYLARSFGLTRRAAGIAALLSLLVNSPFGVGLTSVFGTGLLPDEVGAGLSCLVIGACMRLLQDGRVRHVVLVGLAAAALAVTHLISVMIVGLLLVITLPLLWVPDRPRWEPIRGLLIGAGLAAGLAGFWLVPFLVHHSMHGPVTTWGTPPLLGRLGDIMKGSFVVRPHIAALLLVGAGAAVVRATRGQRWGAAVVLVPAVYIAADRLALHRFPGNSVTLQLENRGIGLVAVIATFGLAAGLAWATRRAGLAGDAVAIVATIAVVAPSLSAYRQVAQQRAPGSAGIAGAARFLRQAVPAGARFTEARQFPLDQESAGVSHPDFWLAWESGRPTLNEFNVEATQAIAPAFLSDNLLSRPAAVDAAELARYGVADVVTGTPSATAHLLESDRFTVAWSGDGWSVLAVAGTPGYPEPASLVATGGPAAAHLVRADPDHLRVMVTSPGPQRATLAVGWAPQWHLDVDGRRVPISADRDGLISFNLPAGTSLLSADYAGDPWAGVGLLVSLLTLVLLAGFLLATRRRLPSWWS